MPLQDWIFDSSHNRKAGPTKAKHMGTDEQSEPPYDLSELINYGPKPGQVILTRWGGDKKSVQIDTGNFPADHQSAELLGELQWIEVQDGVLVARPNGPHGRPGQVADFYLVHARAMRMGTDFVAVFYWFPRFASPSMDYVITCWTW